jgi:DNA mismatch endonuclease (patch repair protein)
LNDRRLPGRPDLVLPRYRAVVFIHGCFWHRHEGCRLAAIPRTRPDFWATKFASNVQRDQRAYDALLRAGWRVAIIWECETRTQIADSLARLAAWLPSSDLTFGVEPDERHSH